jgi:hypothetical protein
MTRSQFITSICLQSNEIEARALREKDWIEIGIGIEVKNNFLCCFRLGENEMSEKKNLSGKLLKIN